MPSTIALPGTDTRLIQFKVDERANAPLMDVGSNVRDFAELMDLAILFADADTRQWASDSSWRTVQVSRLTYGSPFMIDAHVIEQGAQALKHVAIYAGVTSVGGLLWGISRLVKNGAESYKTFQEAKKIKAERKAIEGEEARKQSDWEADRARRLAEDQRSDIAQLHNLLGEIDIDYDLNRVILQLDNETFDPLLNAQPDAKTAKLAYLPYVLVRLGEKASASLDIRY